MWPAFSISCCERASWWCGTATWCAGPWRTTGTAPLISPTDLIGRMNREAGCVETVTFDRDAAGRDVYRALNV